MTWYDRIRSSAAIVRCSSPSYNFRLKKFLTFPVQAVVIWDRVLMGLHKSTCMDVFIPDKKMHDVFVQHALMATMDFMY
jgi:hypothetical protein